MIAIPSKTLFSRVFPSGVGVRSIIAGIFPFAAMNAVSALYLEISPVFPSFTFYSGLFFLIHLPNLELLPPGSQTPFSHSVLFHGLGVETGDAKDRVRGH